MILGTNRLLAILLLVSSGCAGVSPNNGEEQGNGLPVNAEESQGDSDAFDLARILDGQWVLTASGNAFACMEFAQARLVFYAPFCQSLAGVMPNRLRFSNEPVIQDETIRFGYAFSISADDGFAEFVIATFVNDNRFDVFVSHIDSLGDREQYSLSGILAREPF